jgi:hypothetical protein
MCSPKVMSIVEAETARSVHFEKVLDLTHVLEPSVPNCFRLNLPVTPVLTLEEHGVFVNRLTVPRVLRHPLRRVRAAFR